MQLLIETVQIPEKNRYGSHHWEYLKASLPTTRIKRECVILLFVFCLKLYVWRFLCITIFEWTTQLKIYMSNWLNFWLTFFFLLYGVTSGWAKGVIKLLLFNRVFTFIPHTLSTSGVRHHPEASLLRTIGREISEVKYHSWPWF